MNKMMIAKELLKIAKELEGGDKMREVFRRTYPVHRVVEEKTGVEVDENREMNGFLEWTSDKLETVLKKRFDAKVQVQVSVVGTVSKKVDKGNSDEEWSTYVLECNAEVIILVNEYNTGLIDSDIRHALNAQ